MRHQLPGARRRKRARGLLKPQHRMVLGLVSLSAASLMLSLMYNDKDKGKVRVPRTASTSSRPRASVPLPSGGGATPTDASDEAVAAAVAAAGPGIQRCLEAGELDLEPWDGLATAIEVQLDATGLARADVLDMRGAPTAFLGCLGAALSVAPWPSGGDDILLVRVPLRIQLTPRIVPLGGGGPAPTAAD